MESQIQEFFDPHFHLWDLKDIVDPKILKRFEDREYFLMEDYFKITNTQRIKIIGGVVIEVMSVCFKGMNQEEYEAKCLQEAEFIYKCTKDQPSFLVGAAVSLENSQNNYSSLNNLLDKLQQIERFTGIRQIVNFEPSWPRNAEDFFKNEQWVEGYKKLASRKINFDFQLNSHQYQSAISLIQKCPGNNVVIDHMGTPSLKDMEEQDSVYWKQMKEFSKLQNVYIKISYLCLQDKDWIDNKLIIDSAKKIISIFGENKCMFATNYPVDYFYGVTIDKLVEGFYRICEGFDKTLQDKLFKSNAMLAYVQK